MPLGRSEHDPKLVPSYLFNLTHKATQTFLPYCGQKWSLFLPLSSFCHYTSNSSCNSFPLCFPRQETDNSLSFSQSLGDGVKLSNFPLEALLTQLEIMESITNLPFIQKEGSGRHSMWEDWGTEEQRH